MGTSEESVRKVAVVDSVQLFARATWGRFLAWTLCDPDRAVVAMTTDEALWCPGELLLVGPWCRQEVLGIDLEVGSEGTKEEWEEPIGRVGVDYIIAFTDGGRHTEGKVTGGWCRSHEGKRYMLVGSVTTV